LADDCLEIAERCTQQDANAARVHIETKWRMAGRMNAIYNDKVIQELTGANGGPIATQVDTTQLAAMSIEQLRALSGREDEPK
jgi:malate synthase